MVGLTIERWNETSVCWDLFAELNCDGYGDLDISWGKGSLRWDEETTPRAYASQIARFGL